MDRQTRSRRGQALIEATLVAPVVLICISLGIAYVFSIREKFKHDYLEKNQNVKSTSLTAKDLGTNLNFQGRLIDLPKKSVKERMNELKSDGWQIQHQVKLGKNMLYFLNRGNQNLIFDGHFGVITCGKNCAH